MGGSRNPMGLWHLARRELEIELVRRVLEECDGNKMAAARRLGLSYTMMKLVIAKQEAARARASRSAGTKRGKPRSTGRVQPGPQDLEQELARAIAAATLARVEGRGAEDHAETLESAVDIAKRMADTIRVRLIDEVLEHMNQRGRDVLAAAESAGDAAVTAAKAAAAATAARPAGASPYHAISAPAPRAAGSRRARTAAATGGTPAVSPAAKRRNPRTASPGVLPAVPPGAATPAVVGAPTASPAPAEAPAADAGAGDLFGDAAPAADQAPLAEGSSNPAGKRPEPGFYARGQEIFAVGTSGIWTIVSPKLSDGRPVQQDALPAGAVRAEAPAFVYVPAYVWE